ncbi:MAG: cytochrome c oxidase subunit II [Egibacteraceae bacterium]
MTVASAGALDPQGPVARAMAELWWLMLALGVAVFVVFAVLLGIGLFRRPRDGGGANGDGGGANGDDGGPDRRAQRWIVGGGVVMPFVVIVVVFVATVRAMQAIPASAPPDAVVIDVVGHQFWYEVSYPEQGVTARNELHMPVGQPVALRLTSADVIHSFWVPELGGKLDMLPDGTNTLVLHADESGEYVARCAEYCGLEHAHMELTVIAEPEARFTAWVEGQR